MNESSSLGWIKIMRIIEKLYGKMLKKVIFFFHYSLTSHTRLLTLKIVINEGIMLTCYRNNFWGDKLLPTQTYFHFSCFCVTCSMTITVCEISPLVLVQFLTRHKGWSVVSLPSFVFTLLTRNHKPRAEKVVQCLLFLSDFWPIWIMGNLFAYHFPKSVLDVFSTLTIFWMFHCISHFTCVETNYTEYSQMCWIILQIKWKISLYFMHPVGKDFYLSTNSLGWISWLTWADLLDK